MPTIEQRRGRDGKTTYRAKIRIQGQPIVTATFRRKTDARRWAEATEADIRARKYFPCAHKYTVSDAIDRYRKYHLPQLRTQVDAEHALKGWCAALGSVKLSDLTPALIAEERDRLLQEVTCRGCKRTPASVRRRMSVLGRVLSLCVTEWQWLETNPIQQVSKPKLPKGRVRFLSDTERTALLEACRASDSPDLYLAVLLSLVTGGRRSEVLGLRWPDIDWSLQQVRFLDTKNGESRAVPIPAEVIELLKQRVRPVRGGLVFPSRVNPDRPVDLRTPFATALQRVEITDFRWHDLRHCTASYLAMSGATSAEIAGVLGHKTLTMVKRYAHLSEQHTAAVLSRMTQKVFGHG